MVTTIQMEEETVEQLKKLKEKMKVNTYDQVVKQLIKEEVPKSMAGVLKGYKLKELLTDLRDKNDRF